MTTIYNIQPAEIDISCIKGDGLNLSFDVTLNGLAYDMTGNQLDIYVRRKDGLTLKKWSSAGASPCITIAVDNFTIIDTGFLESGIFDYDVQSTDAGIPVTIMGGRWIVNKENTY